MMKKAQVFPRAFSRLVVASVVTFGLAFGGAVAPAGAEAGTATLRSSAPSSAGAAGYVALGDSFTGGQGAPPYLPGPCLQSRFASYPAIADVLSPYRLVANKACSGASTEVVAGQLVGVDPATRLVTLTVGGIDAGSNELFAACSADPTVGCAQAIEETKGKLATLGPRLVGLYSTIAAALPQARVVVLNYPRLFEPGIAPIAKPVNDGTDVLNAVIAGSVAAAANPRITLVDVTQEFAGHGIGARVPYIAFNPADPLATPNLHPNALGNLRGYVRALANDKVLLP